MHDCLTCVQRRCHLMGGDQGWSGCLQKENPKLRQAGRWPTLPAPPAQVSPSSRAD